MTSAVRLGDPGIHAACCGSNTWKAASGSATVFINNKAAVRLGDKTQHCGGVGQMLEGSNNVMIGDSTSAGSGRLTPASPTAMGATVSPSASSKNSAEAAASGDPSSTGSSTGDRNGGSPSAPPSAVHSTAPERREPEPDTFTLWLRPEAISGGALTGERVEIVDPETKEVVLVEQVYPLHEQRSSGIARSMAA